MKGKRSAIDFIVDVIAAGERATQYVSHMSLEQFLADDKTRDAVRMCIADLGEAANKAVNLDPGLKTEFPDFEADAAYAMRNILTHDYFRVDAEILWRTARNSVPKIVADAKGIVKKRGGIE